MNAQTNSAALPDTSVTSEDLMAKAKRSSLFVYDQVQAECDERYRNNFSDLVLHMVTLTVRKNDNITDNQLCGLFRNKFLIPEGVTRRAIKALLDGQPSALIGTQSPYRMGLKRNKPFQATHLTLNPQFNPESTDFSVLITGSNISMSDFDAPIYSKPYLTKKTS